MKETVTGLLLFLTSLLSLPLAAQSQAAQEEPMACRCTTYGDIDIYFWLDSVGPPRSRSVAMRVGGELGRRRTEFTIDTGASINVLSPQTAERLGLTDGNGNRNGNSRPGEPRDSIHVEGMGSTTGRRIVADSLRIGNALFLHVPFIILDPTTGDERTDRYLAHLHAILGRPLLEVLGTTTFDFERQRITAPRRPKRKQKRTRRSNLSIDDNCLVLTLPQHNDTLRLMTDFGATHSTLGPDYFMRHKEEITACYPHPDTVYFGGIGGITAVAEYKMSGFLLRIGRTTLSIPSVSVSPSPVYEPRLGLDFFSRLHRVTFDLRRWRLKVS
jgi:hypothetical protein